MRSGTGTTGFNSRAGNATLILLIRTREDDGCVSVRIILCGLKEDLKTKGTDK